MGYDAHPFDGAAADDHGDVLAWSLRMETSMAQESRVPQDITPSRRLREYLRLVRELSLARGAGELIDSYRARARFVIPADRTLSLSRRDLPAGKVRITRSTTWKERIDPWKEVERLPIVDRGMLPRLASLGESIKIDRLEVAADDPFAVYADGMRSMLFTPIFHEGEPVYALVMLRAEPDSFTLDELCTLVLTTNLIGRATQQLVQSDELRAAYAALDREFRSVGEIQRRLLPARPPSIPGVSIATYYETSRRAGGDYFDFFPRPNGECGILIADVSGHGPAAAVVMAMIRSLLHAPLALVPDDQLSPAGVLQFLNGHLVNSLPSGQFVTAFAALYHPEMRRLRYANAGHHPPRWLRASEPDVTALEVGPGLPLGIIEPHDAVECDVRLRPGDRLLLFTDGITETFDAQRTMFGLEGLDAVLQCCGRSPATLIEAILAAVNTFSGGLAAEDDRTLVAMAFD